ncbi:MAG: CHAT domain-containing protein, partial [Pseudomonadota bacterium]
MIETNNKKEPSPEKTKKNIEELLRERKKLDKVLQSEFSREATLMFTDIVGSTSFFERRGDIEGRSMIQEHNDILFPIIKDYHGTVVKTIGDAIMASFPSPEDGVRSAVQIQRILYDRNKNQSKEDQIKVRIGLNYGKGIVQDNDVFGDVVNVAARVESLADGEQILVSKSIYDEVRRTEDILCRYFDSTEVKGKAEPLEIYRVVWGDEEMAVDRTRSAEPARQVQLRIMKKLFELEITRENDKVKVSGYEKFERMPGRTVIHYEDAQFSPAEIEKHCHDVTSLLNQANKKGKVSKDILIKLQKLGQLLYNGLLTAKAREQLNTTEAEDLIVNIDDQLVQIPWELLYDGKQFFCQRFNMGRLVKTRQAVGSVRIRRVERPLKMLILSDPQNNLPNSHQEGLKLTGVVEKEGELVTANHKTGTVKIDEVRKSLCYYDVIHYAGHADYDPSDPSQSGWLLSDGKFTSHEITCVDRIRPLPALVFSNACHSGQTEEWKIDQKFEDRIYGLANAFLLSGVQHYLGTFWEIQDEPGLLFALEFYQELLKGNTIGEAVRNAREALIKKYGEETIVWASYMLYGDPTYRYFDMAQKTVLQEKIAPKEAPVSPVTRRIHSPKTLIGTVVGALVIAVLLVGVYFRLFSDEARLTKDPVEKAYAILKTGKVGEAEKLFKTLSESSGTGAARGYEGLAAVLFQKGDYQNAQDLCQKVLTSDPHNIYAHVILGNIFFNQGDLDEAIKAYESAAQAEHGASWQKAEAYNRLGR